LVKTAYESGMPRDQLERFLSYQYVPLPWQTKFHAAARQADSKEGATMIGVGGARGPGKSFAVFTQVSLDDCQRVDGLKFLFLRQTGKAASESFEDLIFKALTQKITYKYSKGSLLTFNNQSRIVLGGFETENDIDKYIGIEYDGIAIEELNQLNKDKVDKLLGSMRTSKEGWRPRLYTSFNPGGKGHSYVKKEYVEPYREGTETKTRFIPSTYKENPFLNTEYIDYLEGLEGNLGKAWREGDFDIFESQFFIEWSREKHVVEPFELPDTWHKFRSIDVSGQAGFTSCHWYSVDWDGNVYAYREYYKTGKDSDEHARNIAELSEGESYKYSVMDSAAFSKLGLPETTAEVYARNGVSDMHPSSKNRIMGWDIVHQYLRWTKETRPKLRIFSNCKNLIRTIPEALTDEKNPQDVMSFGSPYEGGIEHQDAIDELRYFLQTLRETKTPAPLNLVQKRLQQIREKDEYNFSYRK